MSTGFFIVGGVIFSIYIYFLIWNIKYGTQKQKEEAERQDILRRYQSTTMDYDGMGDFSRFPKTKNKSMKKNRML
jgi:hypothetical protein